MNLNHLKGDFDLKSFLVEYYKDFDFKITVESIILILILNQLKHDFTKHCLPAQLYVCRTVQEKYCSTIRNGCSTFIFRATSIGALLRPRYVPIYGPIIVSRQ